MITRIRTMIDKEWAEVFKNRLVLFTVIFLPLLMTLLPLGILYGMHASGAAGSATDIPPQFFQVCGSASPEDCAQIFIVNEFMILFMIMPLAIPVAIAAYSVVGEKTTRSLEPLLATPITTSELLAGKSLAAVIPGILATWVCFFIFVLATPLVGVSSSVQAYMLTGTWLLAVLLVGPLAAVMAANFALIVSSRVNDPRAAEQISMVIILPLLLVLFSQIAGVLILNRSLMLLVALAVLILDIALINLGARLFQRETILTKWK